jgi:hypothetical protein
MTLSSSQKLKPSKAVDGILPRSIGVSQTLPTLPIDGGGEGGGEEVRIGTVPEVQCQQQNYRDLYPCQYPKAKVRRGTKGDQMVRKYNLQEIDPRKIDFDPDNPRNESVEVINADPSFEQLKDSVYKHCNTA